MSDYVIAVFKDIDILRKQLKDCKRESQHWEDKWSDTQAENIVLKKQVIDLAKRLTYCCSGDGKIVPPLYEDICVAQQILDGRTKDE